MSVPLPPDQRCVRVAAPSFRFCAQACYMLRDRSVMTMTRMAITTLRHWSLAGGVVLPLLPAAVYSFVESRRVVGEHFQLSPWYSVALLLGMGGPLLLLIGSLLAYALRRPRSNTARFCLGLAIGTALVLLGNSATLRF